MWQGIRYAYLVVDEFGSPICLNGLDFFVLFGGGI